MVDLLGLEQWEERSPSRFDSQKRRVANRKRPPQNIPKTCRSAPWKMGSMILGCVLLVVFCGLYHGKSPWKTTIWGIFLEFFPGIKQANPRWSFPKRPPCFRRSFQSTISGDYSFNGLWLTHLKKLWNLNPKTPPSEQTWDIEICGGSSGRTYMFIATILYQGRLDLELDLSCWCSFLLLTMIDHQSTIIWGIFLELFPSTLCKSKWRV